MGEQSRALFGPVVNRSTRADASAAPSTEDASALALRDVADSLGLGAVAAGLVDHRVQGRITHPLHELVLSRALLDPDGLASQRPGRA